MKILSINTSSNICAAAILEDTTLIKEISVNDANTHSVKLMPIIDELLKATNLSISDIDLFACDKGPGSFTGIRIGISTIKAFCDVTSRPCIGVSALEALAYSCNFEGLICALIDAKNDNVYYGLFEYKNGVYTQIGEFLADNIHNITEILKICNKPVFFVGNGSVIYKDVLQSTLKQNALIQINSGYTNLSAYCTGKAAFDAFCHNKINSITPLYLKKSNAEREWEEKHKCLIIRPMTIVDLESIKSILESDFDDFWNYTIFYQELQNPNSEYFVCLENEQIVGFAGIWISVDDIHITNIVTKKFYRNHGIGAKLLEHLITHAKQKNLSSLTLEVNEANKPAISLYEKYHFQKVGQRKNYYKQNENAIIMTHYF
ncbi:MAG: tRNA (adenosine(37)-N6)-threonylcarbamoyltransferase complex dimerization subunit type 1 TsaB [Clostridia bacterium]|nr:tRNA (adenosine(37)-N6)-threonylcarbamoyltransferase complex dimerization subunit type 1 TsaB [Clostridia bacterium]